MIKEYTFWESDGCQRIIAGHAPWSPILAMAHEVQAGDREIEDGQEAPAYSTI